MYRIKDKDIIYQILCLNNNIIWHIIHNNIIKIRHNNNKIIKNKNLKQQTIRKIK